MTEDTLNQSSPQNENSFSIAINVKPQEVESIPQISEEISVLDEVVTESQFIELDKIEITEIFGEIKNLLPESFSLAQLKRSLELYKSGISSEQLEKNLDESDTVQSLSEKQQEALYAQPYLISIFEQISPEESTQLQTSFSPTIEIQKVPVTSTSSQNSFVFKPGENIVNPILKKVTGKGVGVIKDKVKKQLKKGVSKVLRKGAKKVLKTAAKLGVKAGVSAALPIIGTIAIAAAEKVLGFIKKGITSVLQTVTGEQDLRKAAAKVLLVSAAILFATGQTAAGIGAGIFGAGLQFNVAGSGAFQSFVGGVQSIFYIIVGVVASSILVPLMIAIFVPALVVALILFIINSGAYIVPPAPTTTTGIFESAYINIEKVADPTESASTPVTVTYIITITAKKGTLSNITFDNVCQKITESSTTECPTPDLTPPLIISPTDPYRETYTQTYGSSYMDSLVIDTFTVTADVEGEVTGETAAASASVCIGDCPDECPTQMWPTLTGRIAQGAYCSVWSHNAMEAIDIGLPVGNIVRATHSGVAIVPPGWPINDCLGNHVRIVSVCGGREFYSEYAHLSDISLGITSGSYINVGDTIGLSGNTGFPRCSDGPHLHYRFMYTDGSNPRYPGDPPYMWTPYLPLNIPRGCCSVAECGNIYL